MGLTPRQYLCHVETVRREARRAAKGDVRSGQVVTCAVCGYAAKTIANHLKNAHGMDTASYREMYPDERVVSQDSGFKKGAENPAFGHAGKLSPWCKDFLHGYDAERHEEFKAQHSEFQLKNEANVFRRAAHATDEEYSEAQRRDLKFFVGKYGEDEGRTRHAAKTEKWAKSFRSTNFSMVSQTLFAELDKCVPGAYYATKDMPGMDGYVNKEYVLTSQYGTFRLDFYVPSLAKAVEFDGDYWHSEWRVNHVREGRRTSALNSAGISVLRVREQDYKRNKQGVIEKCIEFLKQ